MSARSSRNFEGCLLVDRVGRGEKGKGEGVMTYAQGAVFIDSGVDVVC